MARGGKATVENIRLRCSGHNQFEADRTFGAGFMHNKREEARRAAAEARTQRAEAEARTRAAAKEARMQAVAAKAEARARDAEAKTCSRAAVTERAKDLLAALTEPQFSVGEVRRAVEFCETMPEATLEERARAALKFLRPKTRSYAPVVAAIEART